MIHNSVNAQRLRKIEKKNAKVRQANDRWLCIAMNEIAAIPIASAPTPVPRSAASGLSSGSVSGRPLIIAST
jgi:hypothetical protein